MHISRSAGMVCCRVHCRLSNPTTSHCEAAPGAAAALLLRSGAEGAHLVRVLLSCRREALPLRPQTEPGSVVMEPKSTVFVQAGRSCASSEVDPQSWPLSIVVTPAGQSVQR